MSIRELVRNFFGCSITTTDVYDVDAWYVMEIKQVNCSTYIEVHARIADSTPSGGRSRYHDREYDRWERVSYVGKSSFTQERADHVQKILADKHSNAHDDM